MYASFLLRAVEMHKDIFFLKKITHAYFKGLELELFR